MRTVGRGVVVGIGGGGSDWASPTSKLPRMSAACGSQTNV